MSSANAQRHCPSRRNARATSFGGGVGDVPSTAAAEVALIVLGMRRRVFTRVYRSDDDVHGYE
jgi:hypothetical protein